VQVAGFNGMSAHLAKKDDNILEVLSQAPWWGQCSSFRAFTYVALRFIIPLIEIKKSDFERLAWSLLHLVAGFLALCLSFRHLCLLQFMAKKEPLD
jgi:hypothetical protein